MTVNVSRAEFERKIAELLDAARLKGERIVITENGREVFEVRPSRIGLPRTEAEKKSDAEILARLRGTVTRYRDPFEPTGLEDWEALR